MHHYTDRQIEFLREQLPGKTYREITDLFNLKFGTELSLVQVSGAIGNKKLRSGIGKRCTDRHFYTDDEIDYIRENLPGRSHKKLTEMFNRRFGLDLSVERVTAAAKNRHINNGLDGRIKKGAIPPNKGRKGYCPAGCEKSWFKKGHRPVKHRPVGSERVNVYGYIEVKVAEPRTWRLKQQVIWEAEHGKVPKGSKIYFCDGNKLNCRIENLMLVTAGELAVMNHERLGGGTREIAEAALLIARIKIATGKRKKRNIR